MKKLGIILCAFFLLTNMDGVSRLIDVKFDASKGSFI